ncbi:hypothetical protein [Selenomonas sp. FC4001]|uniref:hypothetical protein n=1 Tax=Selenomonas sp. FC4001 TaxID=1408313 RepID=UPI00068EF3AE|nr:hypothetical protein [Selenomonas sp. FC4001]
MNNMADMFATYLEFKHIEGFSREDLLDQRQSVVFRTNVVLKGMAVPVGVIIDNSPYVMVRANIATQAITDENAFAVSNLLMRRNYQNRLFKYYLTPDASVILDVCIPYQKGHFSAELVYNIVQLMVKEIMEQYKEFVSVIWLTD